MHEASPLGDDPGGVFQRKDPRDGGRDELADAVSDERRGLDAELSQYCARAYSTAKMAGWA